MNTKLFFYYSILLIGFIAGMIKYKGNNKMLPLILLLCITFFTELTAYYIGKYYRNNMPVYHVYNPVQLCLWAKFFYGVLENNVIKKSIPFTVVVALLFSLINSVFFQHVKIFPDNFIKLSVLFYIVWAGSLFVELLESPIGMNVFKNSFFIVATAVLWFNLISSFYFFLRVFMLKYNISTMNINNIHYFSNIVYYLLLLYAILLIKNVKQPCRKTLKQI